MNWEGMTGLESVNKRINVRQRGVKVLQVVRELYLREDIPCGSELCFEGCEELSDEGGRLPKDVTHYLLPLSDIIAEYFEILRLPELTGIIFLHSAVNSFNFNKTRRVLKMTRNPKKGSVFFPNEFSKFTYEERDGKAEGSLSYENYLARLGFRAASWYYEHLGGQKPIVILTENPQIKATLECERYQVFFLSLEEYLRDFWPNLGGALETYHALKSESLLEGEGKAMFEDYLKVELMESRIKSGILIEGIIRVNKYHSTQEAFVTDFKTKDEILIPGQIHRNRAVEGDVVAVQLLPKSEWRSRSKRLEDLKSDKEEFRWERRPDVDKCGKIVGIVQRNWREYAVSVQNNGDNNEGRKSKFITAVPFDRRIPKISFLTSQNLSSERFVVAIDSWPSNSKHPKGHYVRKLGAIGNLETEIDCLLLENSISVGAFSSAILNEMPDGKDWEPDEDEIKKNRKDLRHSHLIMSIDPQGCTDVDDALSVRTLSNGNLELGVHIADVTFFVKSESFTDREAAERSTTVYLADRRYEMLPSVLSGNVCSLLSGVDRYAVSVLWELDPNDLSKVISVWYGRTVIKSRYKLTYEIAQAVIDETKENEELRTIIPELFMLKEQGFIKRLAHLRKSLIEISKIARSIQANRESEGGLTLDSNEAVFEFDSSDLEDMKPKDNLPIHEVVAECMIFANHWVAKKVSKMFPDFSLLRRHPPPKLQYFDELVRSAKSIGWTIETYSNKALANSLNECNDSKDPLINVLLRSMATFAMVQAVYFSTGSENVEDWYHYGLALGHYTHFTSPIRRYADIIVHRLLIAALKNQNWWDNDQDGIKLPCNSELTVLCKHINEKNKAAQNVQRASTQLFQALYFKNKDVYDSRCIVEGVIFLVKTNGFIVYIPRYALKGPVYLQNEDEEVLWYNKKLDPSWENGVLWTDDETSLHIETAKGRRTYKLFDHVTLSVQLKGSDAHPYSLAFNLLSPEPPKNSTNESKNEKAIDFFRELKLDHDRSINSYSGVPIEDNNSKDEPTMHTFFKAMKRMGIKT